MRRLGKVKQVTKTRKQKGEDAKTGQVGCGRVAGRL